MNALSSPRRPMRRGQALIFSALGMILLVLMVCMTLSFGTKAKAKMEVQIVADQAAYSTAVAVARTYNVLSLVNRVMIAHMTAMLGIQSAISFSGSWFPIILQMWALYSLEIANQMRCCNWGCAFCGCFTALFVLLTRWIPTLMELARYSAAYMGLDAAAAAEADSTGVASMMLYFGQTETVMNQLYRAVDNQKVTDRVKDMARGGVADWQVASGGDKVAKRETGFLLGPLALGVGAINQSNLILSDRHAVMASMASRGHPFTGNRENTLIPNLFNGVDTILKQAFRRLGAMTGGSDVGGTPTLCGPGQRFYCHMGSGYFAKFLHGSGFFPSGASAMADDHGFGLARYAGPSCVSPIPWPIGTFGMVQSDNSMGIHILVPSAVMHQVTAFCFLNCPSAWSNFVDYNLLLVADRSDNYAQPKFPVTVHRDASLSQPDPFNLFFNFRFTPGGKTFDMKHGAGANGGPIIVRDGASGTADISRQMGYGTGITYYHRSLHWREPPNLFNPFWRAGITRPDTDRAAGGLLGIGPDNSHDIEDTLRNSGAGWAASAYSRLYTVAGYQGITP